MAEAAHRHDLLDVAPEAWARALAGRPDLAGLPVVAGWAAAGRPVIARRFAGGEDRVLVPVGLPLPPSQGKRRVGLALPPGGLSPRPGVALAAARAHAPPAWHGAIDAILVLAAAHGLMPRVFGALLWQALTGLTYLGPTSDLDLLWPAAAPVPRALLDGLARIAGTAPMRLDGEILLADGTGIHWRELRAAGPATPVLAKTRDRLSFLSADGLVAPSAPLPNPCDDL